MQQNFHDPFKICTSEYIQCKYNKIHICALETISSQYHHVMSHMTGCPHQTPSYIFNRKQQKKLVEAIHKENKYSVFIYLKIQ